MQLPNRNGAIGAAAEAPPQHWDAPGIIWDRASQAGLSELSADGLFPNVRPVDAVAGPPLCCLVIDAEEDFDWDHPVPETGISVECMRRIVDLRDVTAAYGLRPAYLLTYPVLDDPDIVRLIRRQYDRGECDIGIQLHPWVTPPFDAPGDRASYLGELPAAVEEAKLLALIERFQAAFGFAPQLFRAGRYGLSRTTPSLLEAHGIIVDTSLAPRTDFRLQGGPDFSRFECDPFWFGRGRTLLEMPLCRSLVGWSGSLAPLLYRVAARPWPERCHLQAVLSRLRCAERVTLSPEGNDAAAMRRFLRHRWRCGQRVFTLSFHSSSLAPGRNPYVRERADLHHFYDRLSEILDWMADKGTRFASLSEMPDRLGHHA